ncbi:sortase [Candidatus Woesebacteria bacterium]|nr:sortase [Candidatus Woesebacteria bacterium]
MRVADFNHHSLFFTMRYSFGSSKIVVTRRFESSKKSDSIINWSTERRVGRNDFQPVTLWDSSEDRGETGRILPITGHTNTNTLYTSPVASVASSGFQKQSEVIDPISHDDSVPSHSLQEELAAQTPPAGTIEPSYYSRKTSLSAQPPVIAKQSKQRAGRNALRLSLLGIMIASLLVMMVVVIPDVYYRLQPESATQVTDQISAPNAVVTVPEPTPASLPPVDPSLPLGHILRISTIGVDANVTISLDSDEALKNGAWMVPDFGRPDDFSQPTIIASHRYGWLSWWQSDFGKKNSFYNLPTTKPGDTVEIISDQRSYRYEIYDIEEGKAIEDYSADLILYTCKFLNSPERYFVYAKRLPAGEAPAADSQSGVGAIFDKS